MKHEVIQQVPTLVQQGVELMLFGMGTVFIFLALLVVATTVMSAALSRLPQGQQPTVKRNMPVGAAKSVSDQSLDDETLLAIISASIHKYRSRNK